MNAVVALSSLALEEGRLEPEIEDYIKGVGTASSALLWVITQILEYSDFSDDQGGESPRVALSQDVFTLQEPLSELMDKCVKSEKSHLGACEHAYMLPLAPWPLVPNSSRPCSSPRRIAPKAADAGVELVCDVDLALARLNLVGDPSRLEQCVLNLVDNAIRYSQRGQEVVVHVTRCRASTVADEDYGGAGNGDALTTTSGAVDAAAHNIVDDFFDEHDEFGAFLDAPPPPDAAEWGPGSPTATAATFGSGLTSGGMRTKSGGTMLSGRSGGGLSSQHHRAVGSGRFLGEGKEEEWGRPSGEFCVGLRFDVLDSGVGLSAEAIEALFKPFCHPPPSVRPIFPKRCLPALERATCPAAVRATHSPKATPVWPGASNFPRRQR